MGYMNDLVASKIQLKENSIWYEKSIFLIWSFEIDFFKNIYPKLNPFGCEYNTQRRW